MIEKNHSTEETQPFPWNWSPADRLYFNILHCLGSLIFNSVYTTHILDHKKNQASHIFHIILLRGLTLICRYSLKHEIIKFFFIWRFYIYDICLHDTKGQGKTAKKIVYKLVFAGPR